MTRRSESRDSVQRRERSGRLRQVPGRSSESFCFFGGFRDSEVQRAKSGSCDESSCDGRGRLMGVDCRDLKCPDESG